MRKILFLINASSGLYDFRNTLLLALQKRGDEVAACYPDDRTESEEALHAEGIRIVHVKMSRRGTDPREDFALLRAYKKLIRAENPDLVLTYTIKPNCYGGMAAASLSVPYIATVTGLGSAFQRTGMILKLIKTLYRKGLTKAACVFFQNRENLESLIRLGVVKNVYEASYFDVVYASQNGASNGKPGENKQRVHVVNGSGVDLARHFFEPYPEERGYTEFLYVGRLMKEKGTEELIGAARALKQEYGDKVRFRAVGYSEGDCTETVENAVRNGILTLVPFQSDVHPFYRDADVIVLPSWHEGMSNVLMEGAATGRPLITSDVSGCRETVDDGKSGFLFTVKDESSLLAAMRRFLALSREERAAMGAKARAKMEREFDRKDITKAYLEEIDRVFREEEKAV